MTQRVLVIGSGVAGLSAAWHLAREGVEVEVLERGDRPGGRVGGHQREGFVIDEGPWMLSTADQRLLAALRELELGEEIRPLYSAQRMQVCAGELAAIDPYAARGVMRIPGVRLFDALRVTRLPRLLRHYGSALDPERPERAASLDFRSLADFVGLYFGKSSLERWAGPWLGAASLCEEETASRVLFLLHVVRQLDSAPVVLRSGVDGLVRAITERVETRLEQEVLALASTSAGEVALRVRHSGIEAQEAASAVIVATGPAEALRLADAELSWPEDDFFAASTATAGICVVMGIERSLCAEPRMVQVPHVEGSPLESIWIEPGRAAGRAPKGKTLVRLLANDAWARAHMGAADEVVSKELLAAARVDMGLAGECAFVEVLRTPRAFPRFEVGRYRALARFQSVQADRRSQGRRLYFAGDYLQGPSLEDAFISGRRAAKNVIADLRS